MYFNTKTKEYPRFQGDLESLGWTAGTTLPSDWVEVIATSYPDNVANDFKVVELEPIEQNGVWVQNFDIVPMTAEEIELRNAPITAKAKLVELGFTELEIKALMQRSVL